MSKKFICPKNNTECKNAVVCEKSNEPLIGSIVRIRQEVGGVKWNLAKQALRREINVQFQGLGAEVYPDSDGEDGIAICPGDIVQGDFGQKYGVDIATQGVIVTATKCVENTISDLRR